METSSPLAAIRPPVPSFGQPGLFQPAAHAHLAMNPRGSGTFEPKDQFTNHLQRHYADYKLNVKSVQGSSPAASLAADLSQNFTITESRLVTTSCLVSYALGTPIADLLRLVLVARASPPPVGLSLPRQI